MKIWTQDGIWKILAINLAENSDKPGLWQRKHSINHKFVDGFFRKPNHMCMHSLCRRKLAETYIWFTPAKTCGNFMFQKFSVAETIWIRGQPKFPHCKILLKLKVSMWIPDGNFIHTVSAGFTCRWNHIFHLVTTRGIQHQFSSKYEQNELSHGIRYWDVFGSITFF
jgi:hypothetical protein